MHIPLKPRDESNQDDGIFATSYLRLCERQGRKFCSALQPRPGDGLLGPDGLTLTGEPPRSPSEEEIVIPRLDHLLQIARLEVPTVMLDCRDEDVGCLCFDEQNRPLANVVSRNPEEALLRALLFIRAERASNELSS